MSELKNKVEYRPIEDLNLLEQNPRTITKDNMDRLVESIKRNAEYFEARPIICSDRTGKNVVIAGNQRLRAAQIIGMKEVPTIVIKGLTPEQEREIIIRDNVELGDWDMDILADEWDIQELHDWIGDDFMRKIDWADVDELSDETYEEPEHEMLKCPKCGHIDRKIHFQKTDNQ